MRNYNLSSEGLKTLQNRMMGNNLADRNKLSECLKGKRSRHWKGGVTFNRGYRSIYMPSHPFCDNKGYVREHRLIMENLLGRYLLQNEVVHHIDGDIKNNKAKNLMLFSSHSEHRRFEKDKEEKCKR